MENEEYLECDLPVYLKCSLEGFIEGQRKLNNGEHYMQYDLDADDLNSSINIAENNQQISSKQAWYLRRKYLGMEEGI